MTTIQMIVEELKKHKDGLTSKELEKKLKLTPGSVSGAVWRLERSQSVSRNDGVVKLIAEDKVPNSRSGPKAERVVHKGNGPRGVHATMEITLTVKHRTVRVTLAEANKLYEELSAMLNPVRG